MYIFEFFLNIFFVFWGIFCGTWMVLINLLINSKCLKQDITEGYTDSPSYLTNRILYSIYEIQYNKEMKRIRVYFLIEFSLKQNCQLPPCQFFHRHFYWLDIWYFLPSPTATPPPPDDAKKSPHTSQLQPACCPLFINLVQSKKFSGWTVTK